MHVVVLGAGLAGLAAAWELVRAGARVTLLEKAPVVGGLATSWQVGPYWLELGPHRFHSRDPELVAHLFEILGDRVVQRERLSRILLRGRFFDYPLKLGNVLRNLPPHLLLRALGDYAWTRVAQVFRPIPDDNFENWVLKRFGRTLYDLFFGTYTAKAWCMPCTSISADWASQRISQANLWDTIVKTIRPPRAGEVRSLVSEFHYPAEGGIGSIARGYAEKLREKGAELRLGAEVTGLEREGNRLRSVAFTGEGEEQRILCDRVVSTIPLSLALSALRPAPEQTVREAIAGLRHIAIVFVYLAVDRPSVVPDHWIYLPSPEFTIHRLSEFKNFSDTAAPEGSTAVCCEITCPPGEGHWNLTLEEGARLAEADLVRAGLVEPGQTRPLDIRRARHAYPVYDLAYRPRLELLQRAAGEIVNLDTTGRQGLFRYNNMDHTITMGRRLARGLLEGSAPEASEVASGEEYFG